MSHEDLNSNAKLNKRQSRLPKNDKLRKGYQQSEDLHDLKLPPTRKSEPKHFSLRQTKEKFSTNQISLTNKPKVR